MYKYYLGFNNVTKNDLTYVVKNAFVRYFNEEKISYTFSLDDEFEEAIVPSGYNFFSLYVALSKRNCKVNVIAVNDLHDFVLKKTKKGVELTLSLDAINYYRKADCLYIFFPSQAKFLESYKIKTPIKKLPVMANDFHNELTPCEKDAFLHEYRLTSNRQIIVSYGLLTKKETVMDLRAIARNSPEKDFLFFGQWTNEAMKQTLFEGITKPKNLFFYDFLPEEFYPSFLEHCSCLLLLGDYLSYPQVMIDCLYHKIPIITYKSIGYEDLLNENIITKTTLYSQLYYAINRDFDKEKVQNAFSLLKTLQNYIAYTIIKDYNF